ncbi:MAG: manganese/iron transport system substrate-binding protein [Actinomycetota bacterium]|nr:manganese/iron transport system substrate-binding protein [Actinomycetota bacterium]
MRRFVVLAVVSVATAGACSASGPGSTSGKLQVVASVSPLVDIVRNVAGEAADVQGLIPEGVDSHTFEPTPDTARALAEADVIFLNGLDLEDPTLALAQANKKDGAVIFLLGEHAIDPSQYLYDFSFPKAGGHPNPHLWMDVANAISYTKLVQQQLDGADPANKTTYDANAKTYLATLDTLNHAVKAAVDTVPPAQRKLLTYHDSFAYFAAHYGMTVIGAIQPVDFAEPSGQEVAALIDQIKAQHIPAIFGSEVFPSPVLAQIAEDTGAKYEDSLRDDDLPGAPGDPEHSYVGLMLYDVRTIVTDLGGDPSALDTVPDTNPYD